MWAAIRTASLEKQCFQQSLTTLETSTLILDVAAVLFNVLWWHLASREQCFNRGEQTIKIHTRASSTVSEMNAILL